MEVYLLAIALLFLPLLIGLSLFHKGKRLAKEEEMRKQWETLQKEEEMEEDNSFFNADMGGL